MKTVGTILWLVIGVMLVVPAYAQQQVTSDNVLLEKRVEALEHYVRALQPAMEKFSRGLFNSMQDQIKVQTGQVIGMDPFSKKVSKIETNTGTFLFSIKKIGKIRDGYRLYVNIGNPGLATYNGVTLDLKWGPSWSPDGNAKDYKQWRASLDGARYSFSGDLKPGTWTQFTLDISPVSRHHFEYLECEMSVDSVSLKQDSTASP